MVQGNALYSMNYLTSAYQQVAATGQAIKQQAQDVKNRTQQLVQLMSCFQNRLGCSATQLNSIDDVLRSIKFSLMPLTNISLGAKVQKPVNFIQSKINELQATIKSFGTRFTAEQKAAFISTVKKVAVAAAVLVAAVAIAMIAKSVSGGKKAPTKDVDDRFVAAFVKKDLKAIRTYLDQVSLTALSAAQAMVEADRNYPERNALLTELRIAIHNREAFPEVYQEGYLPEALLPDDQFITYVIKKNIPTVQDWLRQDVPTIDGLIKAERIIESDSQYPNRNSLLGTIRQKIHAKEFAEDIKERRESIGR